MRRKLYMLFRKLHDGTGKISQQLKVFAALTEGLGSVPSTHGQQLSTVYNSGPTRCDTTFWLLQVPAHTHIHTACTHNKQM